MRRWSPPETCRRRGAGRPSRQPTGAHEGQRPLPLSARPGPQPAPGPAARAPGRRSRCAPSSRIPLHRPGGLETSNAATSCSSTSRTSTSVTSRRCDGTNVTSGSGPTSKPTRRSSGSNSSRPPVPPPRTAVPRRDGSTPRRASRERRSGRKRHQHRQQRPLVDQQHHLLQLPPDRRHMPVAPHQPGGCGPLQGQNIGLVGAKPSRTRPACSIHIGSNMMCWPITCASRCARSSVRLV